MICEDLFAIVSSVLLILAVIFHAFKFLEDSIIFILLLTALIFLVLQVILNVLKDEQ